VLFLDTVGEAVEVFGLEVHGYALLPNHYHLLVRVPLGNLSRCMRHINASYTQRLNRIHRWDGPLFRGRFGSRLVTDEAWLVHLVAYLHLNPVKANLITRADEPGWTSHRAYIGLEPAPAWLSTERLLDTLGGREAVDDFVRTLHIGRSPWPEAMNTADGWLRPETLLPVVIPAEQPIKASASAAEVLACVERITGLTEAEITEVRRGPGGNPAKRFLIWALWRRARMTQRAIGTELGMTAPHVARVLARFRRGDLGEPIEAWQAELVGESSESIKC
jgi:REP element-mobilizing transposase RayT